MVELWSFCRAAGEGATGCYAHLPDRGGINDQSAWLMQAFRIIEGAISELRQGIER